MSEMALETRSLTVVYDPGDRQVMAIRDLSLALGAGESLALVGESGSGKSTLALTLLGLLPPAARIQSGSARMFGLELVGASASDLKSIRGRIAAFVPQDPASALNPVFRIGTQLAVAARYGLGISRAEAKLRAVSLLAQVGMPDPKRNVRAYPHELSVGMQQRTLIALALASNPRLLIADEPTSALDVTLQAQIVTLLKELRVSLGLTLLFVTHDFGLINELADHVAVLYSGQLVEWGSFRQILSAPQHPYTKQLLDALPSRHTPGSRLKEIPGVVARVECGCPFAMRCHEASQVCRETFPRVRDGESGQRVWCHAVPETKQL